MRTRTRTCGLHLEVLEDRVTPAGSYIHPAGPEFRANVTTASNQYAPAVAALAGGGYVVTWTSELQDGSYGGVYGQRYAADGTPTGSEFRANTYTTNDQRNPAVASLAGGGFVITWQSFDQDYSGDGVYGQRYAADGSRAGPEFRANIDAVGNQQDSAVAGLAGGGYVVTWSWYREVEDYCGEVSIESGVSGQRYAADGSKAGAVFAAPSITAYFVWDPAVAGLPDGGFVLTWTTDQDGSGWGVYGQRYAASGTAIGPTFRANTTAGGDQSSPAVAALAGGGFVVTWQNSDQDSSGDGVYGQRYAADGSRAGPEFRANTTTANAQNAPAVAGVPGGGFVVTWQSELQDGSDTGVFGQRYAADGASAGAEFRANTYTTGRQIAPTVAALAGGGIVVMWTSESQDGTGSGVYGQRYVASASNEFPRLQVPLPDQFLLGEAISLDLAAHFHDPDGDPLTFAAVAVGGGGALPLGLSLDAAGRLTGTAAQTGRYVIALGAKDMNGYGLSTPVRFTVDSFYHPAGPEFRTNATSATAVAALAGGGFVVTWQSEWDDELGFSVRGQRYTADGTPAGPEIRPDNTGWLYQYAPPVAALAGGGFVIAWNGQFGGGSGVYGQRYAADGTLAAPEFRAITYTSDFQKDPAVSALTGGGFVVTWQGYSADYRNYGVYGQRYAAEGTPAGPEFQANTTSTGYRGDPAVAGLTGGGFLVSWTSDGQDGSGAGVYGQRYAADGTRVGSEFPVNTYTTRDQGNPTVAGLSAGGFVVAWESRGQDGSDSGVYGQRYAADGTPAGPEFRANTYTDGWQGRPAVAGLVGGGFVVTWDGFGLVTGTAGAYGQRYSADGTQAGPEFRASTTTAAAGSPAVARLPGGSFVVMYSKVSGVYGQRYELSPRPSLVGGVHVNGGQTQRSRVTTLTLSYDSVLDVAGLFQPGAFSLTRAADGATVGAVTVAATIAGGRTTVVLTFGGAYTEFGSLADGRWVLTVNRDFIRTPDGPSLAADYTSPVFHRLYGDVNGDGAVNGLDLSAFRPAFGSSIGDPAYVAVLDFDGDGAITGADLTQFRNRFGAMV